jgi:hypothetical protein
MLTIRTAWTWAVCLLAAAATTGCGEQGSSRNPRATEAVEARIVAKWHKRLDELPARKLVLISPHNESIANEFTWAFVVDYALAHGRRVNLEWRDVGGGGTGIVRYLRNVYDHADTADIDIVWGGGQVEFQKLAGEGLRAYSAMGLRLARMPMPLASIMAEPPAFCFTEATMPGL